MNEPLRRGIRMALLLVLLLSLFTANTSAGAGQASQAGTENTGVIANSNGTIIESVKLNGLIQARDPQKVDPGLIQKLKQNARGAVSISTKKSTEFASFVHGQQGRRSASLATAATHLMAKPTASSPNTAACLA